MRVDTYIGIGVCGPTLSDIANTFLSTTTSDKPDLDGIYDFKKLFLRGYGSPSENPIKGLMCHETSLFAHGPMPNLHPLKA
jgi:hypothetical protein